MQDIGNLALILVTTLVLAHVSRLLKMPAVIGELLAGILIGPALLGWISSTHTISLFAEIGVIILMFLAGLESNLDLLKKYFKPGMLVAVIGVIVPVVVVFGFAHLWGFNLTSSLFLGITFAATSVSISVEVLKELHALEGRNGATILGGCSRRRYLDGLNSKFYGRSIRGTKNNRYSVLAANYRATVVLCRDLFCGQMGGAVFNAVV